MNVKAEWRSAACRLGEQSATTSGTALMQELRASSWAILHKVQDFCCYFEIDCTYIAEDTDDYCSMLPEHADT